MAAQARNEERRRSPLELGRTLAGTPYRVLGLIGQGGMGSVYEVKHVELGRNFVLKVLHEQFAGRRDLVARMRNEWTALARLSHPNIVQVTDAGRTTEGRPYYVMERLEGDTLAALVKRRGSLSMHEASGVVIDVLSGLSAAHAIGAVHRDVKPQNIFVVRDGPTKLLDFGIAQVRDQVARVVTAAGVSIGTPRYMAPEQAEGKRVDGRADIYAVALVLYEMLLGKGPFAHLRDHNALVLAHIAEEPARLDAMGVGVSEEMADLVHRWLSKNPDSRPCTAAAARAELAALRASLPNETRGDTTTSTGDYDAATLGADVAPHAADPETSEAPTSVLETFSSDSVESLAPTVSMPPHSARRGSGRLRRIPAWTSGKEEPVALRDAARLAAAWGASESAQRGLAPSGAVAWARRWGERWGAAVRLSFLVAALSFGIALAASSWWSQKGAQRGDGGGQDRGGQTEVTGSRATALVEPQPAARDEGGTGRQEATGVVALPAAETPTAFSAHAPPVKALAAASQSSAARTHHAAHKAPDRTLEQASVQRPRATASAAAVEEASVDATSRSSTPVEQRSATSSPSSPAASASPALVPRQTPVEPTAQEMAAGRSASSPGPGTKAHALPASGL